MTTGIQWTDETWNPVVGCTNVSPGCDHCYAATVASRQMQPAHVGLTVGRRWNGTVRLLPERLDQPLRWKRPRRVFVNSMSDLFHQDVPDWFIARLFAVMAIADRHTFQVLTKRPQRMAALLSDTPGYDPMGHDPADHIGASVFSSGFHSHLADLGAGHLAYNDLPLPNVWLGTSIETDRYTFRARHLAACPAAIRFLSVEPLLGPVDLTGHLTGVHWVIVGCESGPGRRHCDPAWIRNLRDQCAAAEAAFFVKQIHSDDGQRRVLHDLDDFPPDLRIREWPA